MDPYITLTKKFTKKFGSKIIKRQFFYRKTGLWFYFFSHKIMLSTAHKIIRDDFDDLSHYILDGKEIEF